MQIEQSVRWLECVLGLIEGCLSPEVVVSLLYHGVMLERLVAQREQEESEHALTERPIAPLPPSWLSSL